MDLVLKFGMLPEQKFLVPGVLKVLEQDPVLAADLRFLDLLLNLFGLESEKLVVCVFSPLPYIPHSSCQTFLSPHFCTDWLSRLGIGNQVGSTTDHLKLLPKQHTERLKYNEGRAHREVAKRGCWINLVHTERARTGKLPRRDKLLVRSQVHSYALG